MRRPDLFTVRFDVPAICASLLHDGHVDLGLIPAIEYLRGDYAIVPDIAIGSDGPVASVAMFTTVPIERVRDAGARPQLADVGGADADPVRQALGHRSRCSRRPSPTSQRCSRAPMRRWSSAIRRWRSTRRATGHQDRSRRGVEGADRAAVRLCHVGRPRTAPSITSRWPRCRQRAPRGEREVAADRPEEAQAATPRPKHRALATCVIL